MPSFISNLLGVCFTAPNVRHDDESTVAAINDQHAYTGPAATAGRTSTNAPMQSAFASALVAANAAAGTDSAPAASAFGKGLKHVSSCPILPSAGGRPMLQQSSSFNSSIHQAGGLGDGNSGLHSSVPIGGMHGRRPSGSMFSADSCLTSARSESVFEIASRTSSLHSKILRLQSSQPTHRAVSSSSFIQRHLSLQPSGSISFTAPSISDLPATAASKSKFLTELQIKHSESLARRVFTAPTGTAALAATNPGALPPRTLLSAALDRTDSARLTKTGTGASTSTSSLGASGRGSSSSLLTATASDDAAAEGGAATAFGEGFLVALLAGNGRWASEASVFELFVEDARMATHDKEVFYGKTAIIRRLNGGG